MRRLIAVLALAALLPACATTYRDEFLKSAKAKGWTKEQQYAALYRSYRLYFAKEAEDGKYTVIYSRLPLKDVRQQLDDRLNDLSYILDYKEEGWNQYLKTFNLRGHFEHEEQRIKGIRARVRVAELNNVFLQLIGEKSSYYGYGSDNDPSEGFNPSVLVEPNMAKAFPFTSKTVTEAREKGVLQPVETFTVNYNAKYDRKEPDPDYPNDPAKFIWRSREYALDVTKYKVVPDGEKPTDNYGNYLEAFRIVDGKKESKPALKAFLDGSGGSAVIVVDSDFEKTVTGNGLPNFVEKVPERTVTDSGVLDMLFPDDPAKHRIEPKLPPMRLEIARVGGPVDVWEKAPDAKGWPGPTGYKTEPVGDNYNVRIQYKKLKKDEDHASAALKGREVEYFIREYTEPGNRYKAPKPRVMEYFAPKPAYAGKFGIAKVEHTSNTKKLLFVGASGDEDTGYLTPAANKYIGDKPVAIAYTIGEKRYWLQDDDGDGVFEKRRQVGPPKLETGAYNDYDTELRAGSGHDDMDMGGSRTKQSEAIEPKRPDNDKP